MPTNSERRGLLIAFEGIDGCGKSSHLRKLAAFLRERGAVVVETHEPTEGPCGQKIRAYFHRREELGRDAELDLFLQDRRDHVVQCINPALEAGQVVLTDRYYFSNAAYQGAVGMDVDEIFALNAFAPEPDLTLILRVPPSEAVRRIRENRGEAPNDFEQEDRLVQVDRVFSSFTHPCIRRIDSSAGSQIVQAQIRELALTLLQSRGWPCL